MSPFFLDQKNYRYYRYISPRRAESRRSRTRHEEEDRISAVGAGQDMKRKTEFHTADACLMAKIQTLLKNIPLHLQLTEQSRAEWKTTDQTVLYM